MGGCGGRHTGEAGTDPALERLRQRFASGELTPQEYQEQVTISTPDFTMAVDGFDGMCRAGEACAERKIAEKNTPLLACEGPCIRGEIARLAANIVAQEVPGYARACHAETFFVPHSAMARWVKQADHSVMIDGCFLRCNGRVVDNLVEPKMVLHTDTNPMHHKYADLFLMDDVPEEDRKATARDVSDRIIQVLAKSEQR